MPYEIIIPDETITYKLECSKCKQNHRIYAIKKQVFLTFNCKKCKTTINIVNFISNK